MWLTQKPHRLLKHQCSWLQQIYAHGRNKIIFRSGPPAESRAPWCCSNRLSPTLPINHNHLWPERPAWWKNSTPSYLQKNETCCSTNYQLIKRNPSGLFQVRLYFALGKCHENNQSRQKRLPTFVLVTISVTKTIFYIFIKLLTLPKRQVGFSTDGPLSVNN